MPGIFNLDHAGNLELRRLKVGFTQTCRLKAWECPIAGPTQSTPLSCQFCATQCNLRCDARCQTRAGCVFPPRGEASSGRKSRFCGSGWQTLTSPSLFSREGLKQLVLVSSCQCSVFLRLAASIAARLTIWPISLACSASERICACTYSP